MSIKPWHVTITIPTLTGASIREIKVLADTRANARDAGLLNLRVQEPALFAASRIEGVPRVTARPA